MLSKGVNEFKISIDYDDYFANSQIFKATNIEVVGDSIMFQTDKETIDLIEQKNIRYMLHYSKKKEFLNFFKYRTGILVGLLVVIFMIVINSFRVSSIEFSGDYPINPTIEEYINSQNQQMLFFSFHKHNYQDLSKELRSVFNEYEWISISKKGSKIYVDIEPTTTKDVKLDDDIVGNIVASKSGIVTEYVVFNGKGQVEVNTYVKAGDTLIDGQAKKAKGYVLATVYEQRVITIKKENKVEELSGKVNKYNQLNIFNKLIDVNKKENYDFSIISSKTVFSIPYIININKIEEYEKNDIIYTYDSVTAVSYAKSIIEDEFNKEKVLAGEKILRIEGLSVIEQDEAFQITLLIKKIESIGEFKETV